MNWNCGWYYCYVHTVDKPVLAKLEEELMMEEEEPQTSTKAKTRLRILVVEDEIEIKAYLKSNWMSTR